MRIARLSIFHFFDYGTGYRIDIQGNLEYRTGYGIDSKGNLEDGRGDGRRYRPRRTWSTRGGSGQGFRGSWRVGTMVTLKFISILLGADHSNSQSIGTTMISLSFRAGNVIIPITPPPPHSLSCQPFHHIYLIQIY